LLFVNGAPANGVESDTVLPGDRVRLAHPHRDLLLGAEGVVAAFSRREDVVLVTVHFEGRDEVVPETELAVVPYGRGRGHGSSLVRSRALARCKAQAVSN